MQQQFVVQLLKGVRVSALGTFIVEAGDDAGFDAMMVFAAKAAAAALCTESREEREQVRVLCDGAVYMTEQEASKLGAAELGW